MTDDCAGGFRDGDAVPDGADAAGNNHAGGGALGVEVNAASSVLGSAAAMFLAIYLGLKMTLCIGGLFYLAALREPGDFAAAGATLKQRLRYGVNTRMSPKFR